MFLFPPGPAFETGTLHGVEPEFPGLPGEQGQKGKPGLKGTKGDFALLEFLCPLLS
jgi:hypothetical protein